MKRLRRTWLSWYPSLRDLHQPSGYHHPAKSGHLKPPLTFSFFLSFLSFFFFLPFIPSHLLPPSLNIIFFHSLSLTHFVFILGIHSKRMKRKICDDDSKDPVHLSFCFTKTHSNSLSSLLIVPTSNCPFFYYPLTVTTNK